MKLVGRGDALICNIYHLCDFRAFALFMVCALLESLVNPRNASQCHVAFPFSHSIAARKSKVLKKEVVEINCQSRLPYTGRKIV